MNTKIIIGTRLFAWPIGRFDCVAASTNKDILTDVTNVANTFFIPSLLNQTDKEYIHYTIINNNANTDIINEYFIKPITDTGFNTIIIRAAEWNDMLNNELVKSKNEGVNLAVSRTDVDDAIHKDVIKNIRHTGNNLNKSNSIIYGLMNGLHYRIGSNNIRQHNITYRKTGHMSVMQTAIVNTNYDNIILNPYHWDHSNVANYLLKQKIPVDKINKYIIDGDSDLSNEPGYIYIRHNNSIATINKEAYDADNRFPIIKDILPDFILDRFGVKIDCNQ